MVVNDILYNNTSRVTTIFIDYLIFDEDKEFLHRAYALKECQPRLNRLCAFYQDYDCYPTLAHRRMQAVITKNTARKQRL